MTVVFGGQYIAATSDLICSFDPMINQLTERERNIGWVEKEIERATEHVWILIHFSADLDKTFRRWRHIIMHIVGRFS